MQVTLTLGPECETSLREIIRAELAGILAAGNFCSDERPLRRSDIAELFQISLVTVHEWMKQGVLPHYKLNGRTYFRRSEVMEAMNRVKVKRR
ncbi:helix-turn-helix domain-containing protein [Chryseolinea sp. T2]|uniref:helix-turn-helix domain-containing protein n=1 Tax=Chryseolinea sp. T2 TaxID=3129255 RepID=UPI003077897F